MVVTRLMCARSARALRSAASARFCSNTETIAAKARTTNVMPATTRARVV